MPTYPVRSIASSTASTKVPTCSERRVPTTSRTSAGRSSGSRIPARTASSKSWQTYAIRSAHATTSPSGVAGGGRRHEWLRTPSSVSTAEVELGERDVGAVDRVVVAAVREVRRERLLRRVPGRAVPAVVGEGDRLHERDAQVGGPGDAGGHLRDLDRVGEPGAEMVVFGGDEHLALAGEPPPRTRVLHPIEVALEAQPVRVGLLGTGPLPRPDRPGRARRERTRPSAGFPLLAGAATARPRTRRRPGARVGRTESGGPLLWDPSDV